MNNDDVFAALFDAGYYISQARVNKDPLKHFLGGGWRKFDPHPLFSSSFYLAKNPDVMRENVNPLVHWVEAGWREKRTFHELFDVGFYLSQLGEDSDVDVLRHFLGGGWRKFDPHPLFSSSFYLAKNPDVMDGPQSPFEHFVTSGGALRLQHHPLFEPNNYKTLSSKSDIPVADFIRSGGLVDTSRLFNLDWYLTQSAEARTSPDPPVVHWIKVGSKQGISPTSHPIATLLSDLLAEDPVAGVLIADLEIPRSSGVGEVRILPFRTEVLESSKELSCCDSDVFFSGDLPGVITRDGRLVGMTGFRPVAVRHRLGRSVVQGLRGLVSGVVSYPKVNNAIIALTPEDGEVNWLLSVLPQIRKAAEDHPGVSILTNCKAVRDHVKNLSQHVLAGNPIEFVPSGILKEVRAARPLIVAEDCPILTEPPLTVLERGLRVLLIDEDDDLSTCDLTDLRDLLAAGRLTLLDMRWPADLVLSVLADAETVIASRALAVATTFTRPNTEVIACEGNGARTNIGGMVRSEAKEYLRGMEKNNRYPSLEVMAIRHVMER